MILPSLTVATNSYISKADAITYFKNRLNVSAWNDAGAGDHERALITASKTISLAVANEYKLGLDSGDITTELKDATCELALAMLNDLDVITNKDTSENVKKVGAGPAAVEFFRPVKGSKFPPLVMSILKQGGLVGGTTILIGMSYGTDSESSFCDSEKNNITEGLR